MEEIFAPSYARTFIWGRFYKILEKPFSYIFVYLGKDGIHHCFQEIRGRWKVTYTDAQLIGRKVEELKMKKVFICTPFRQRELKNDILQVRKMCILALKKGCIPYSPQLYCSQFLPLGSTAGTLLSQMWLSECNELWIIGEKITEEMRHEIETAERLGIPVQRRSAP